MSFIPAVVSTELDAVNVILQVIGEAPVSELEEDNFLTEAGLAHQMLHSASRDVQADGLYCNTEYGVVFSPDVDGHISVPGNILKFIIQYRERNVTIRKGALYDLDEHTDEFEGDVEAKVVYFLDFDALPQAVRNFITIKAARQFQTRILGSTTLAGFTEFDERDALRAMYADEADTAQPNPLLDSPLFRGLYNNRRR